MYWQYLHTGFFVTKMQRRKGSAEGTVEECRHWIDFQRQEEAEEEEGAGSVHGNTVSTRERKRRTQAQDAKRIVKE